MAIQLETSTKRFRGLSTDEKPGHSAELVGGKLQTPPVGSIFTEVDTGKRYYWIGSWPWVQQKQTIETILVELIDVNSQILETLQSIQRGHEEYAWENEVEPL